MTTTACYVTIAQRIRAIIARKQVFNQSQFEFATTLSDFEAGKGPFYPSQVVSTYANVVQSAEHSCAPQLP
jgi:hypothetical protein